MWMEMVPANPQPNNDLESSPTPSEDSERAVSDSSHSNLSTPPQCLVYDPVYYYPHGDCVILVENTLFKVHRNVLERDHSAFADMFSLPQGRNSTLPQNITDDDPLRLDDTANQFRALCWILYALPLEIVNQHRYADMGRILPLVVIANKYGFRSLEEWGFDVLNHHCEGGLDFLTRCSVSELSLLADIAVLSDYTQYTTRLIGLIQEKSLSRLKVSTTSPLVNVMLEIGEKHSWDSYLGKVYSQIVHAITYDSVDTPIGLSESHTRMIQAVNTLGLKPEQEMRLYKGYIALVQFWDSFVRNRAKIDVELCPHNHNWDRCRENISQAWNSIFQAVSVSHPSADVDGKLGYIINQFASSSVRDWRDVHCWSSIRDRVKNIREDVLANIPRLFVGN